MEEEVLYPAVRRALPEGDRIVERALAEHREQERLIDVLASLDHTAAGITEVMGKLDAGLKEHVAHEELEVFPALRGALDPARLDHAAINNPDNDPVRHARVREERGMRPGGFGLFLAARMVDELVYNERHNEVLLVKYLS